MAEIILIVIFIIVVWGLFYYVARVLGDSYDKKPLKYIDIKKVENNKIEINKYMENKEEKQLVSNEKSMNYFQKLYSGRIGRKSYILGSLLLLFICVVAFTVPLIFSVILFNLLSLNSQAFLFTSLNFAWIIIVAIIAWVYSFSLCMRRLHDMGKSRWWLVISVLPLINLWLVFQKGDADKNQYGDVPPKDAKLLATIFGDDKLNNNFLKDNWWKILILLVFACLVISIFYLTNQNVENRKFMNQPIIKDNSLEIEKCRASTKNLTQEQLDNIVHVLTEFNKTEGRSSLDEDKMLFKDMETNYLQENYLKCLRNIK